MLEDLINELSEDSELEDEPEQEPTVFLTYEDFPYEDLITYAGIDCIATSTVLAKIMPSLVEEVPFYTPNEKCQKVLTRSPAIIKSISEIEMIAHEYIIDLEINGMMYDVALNQDYSKRMTRDIATLQEGIFTAKGEFNWSSGTELAKFLYGEQGLTAPYETKGGEPATDGEALLTLAGIDPKSFKYTAPDPSNQWLADLAKMRDINSTHNTFVKNYVKDFVDPRDFRIRPSYNLHGTSSFRITGSNPNLTQLPRPKHGYNLRECYTVGEGMVFIAADWSSAEVKILAMLCRDNNMLKAIEMGYDFHSFSASSMIGVPYQEFVAALDDKTHKDHKFYKLTRQSAKALR